MKTKGFALAVIAVFLLNVCISAQAKQEQPIDKIVFVHRANGPNTSDMEAKPGGGGGGGGQTKLYYKWGGLHWDQSNIQYVIDATNSGLQSSDVVSTLDASFETWDSEVTNVNIFADKGTTGSAGVYETSDGINEVWFQSIPQSSTIAVTYIWYNSNTKEVQEVDTIFNTYYTWVKGATPGTKTMDLQNIATHEFGHWLVLDDLYTRPASAQTMYGYSSYAETSKISLESGDIAGIHLIYGP